MRDLVGFGTGGASPLPPWWVVGGLPASPKRKLLNFEFKEFLGPPVALQVVIWWNLEGNILAR
jgi:hypothetical protein